MDEGGKMKNKNWNGICLEEEEREGIEIGGCRK
jgi:hypothetical protein